MRKKEAFKLIVHQYNTDDDNDDDMRNIIGLNMFSENGEDDEDDAGYDDGDGRGDDDHGDGDGDSDFLEELLDKTLSSDWFSGYYRYESISEITKRLKKGDAISGFFIDDLSKGDQMSICVAFGKTKKNVKFIKLECRPSRPSVEHCGLLYCIFEAEGGDTVKVYSKTKQYIRRNVKGCCIMLPNRMKDFTFAQQFALITHDWKTMVSIGGETDKRVKIGTPELSRELYQDCL